MEKCSLLSAAAEYLRLSARQVNPEIKVAAANRV
jgi:hypothetical protein